MKRTEGEITQDGHREQDEAGVAVLELLLAHAGRQPLQLGLCGFRCSARAGITT